MNNSTRFFFLLFFILFVIQYDYIFFSKEIDIIRINKKNIILENITKGCDENSHRSYLISLLRIKDR